MGNLVKHTICQVALLVGIPALMLQGAQALPYSAESTTRESLKVTATGATSTYAELSEDSTDLSFQITDDGKTFVTFASKDATLDDLGTNRCTTSGISQVYWVDKTSGKPAVCVSVANKICLNGGYKYTIGGTWEVDSADQSGEGWDDSYKPFIGGPSSGSPTDEGRYVVFQTNANNLKWAYVIDGENAFCYSSDYPSSLVPDDRQIIVHDRKWEETWMSSSSISADKKYLVPNGPSFLHGISKDGQNILLTSSATNLIDNIDPKGSDENGSVKDVMLRDGASCVARTFGSCTTDVIYDTYELHAGANNISQIQQDAKNAAMTPDGATFVFDTKSTVPVHFLPDSLSFNDIFMWKNEAFSLVSQTQVAVATDTKGTIVFKNVGGAPNGDSYHPRISSNGKLIVFDSDATDLVLASASSYKSNNGYTQVYLHNRDTDQTEMISITPSGAAGNGKSEKPWISEDGRFVVFESLATNLLSGITTTAYRNIFMYDRSLGTMFLVTPGPNPSYPSPDTRTVQGINADAYVTFLAPNGLTIAYETVASNAINSSISGVLADTNGKMDVFLAANDCPEDSDGDGTPDCLDLCPNDGTKNAPGQCGCGVAEKDTDNDGTADCKDACPNDPAKIATGQCGCGVEDKDSDADGTADCVDQCPFSTKPSPGVCGCGVADTDANGNGNADCIDPSASLTPVAPVVKNLRVAKGVKPRARVTAQSLFPSAHVEYEFTLTQKASKSAKKKAVKTRVIKTTQSYATFKNLAEKTGYTASYVIRAGTTVTKSSPEVSFTSGRTGR